MPSLRLSEACRANEGGLDFRLPFSKLRPLPKCFDKKHALAKEFSAPIAKLCPIVAADSSS